MIDRLPIDDVIPALLAALREEGRAVLVAPPGAGKTTRVPLALLADGAERVVVLEPRRLAARAAAARMAETLGEAVGRTVGYRMRGEARVSDATRIEVVTEGVLTRRIQGDPALEGVSHLVFDEFHERSLDADLGLALAWEARGALRPDLRLLVMSATLDAGPVAALMDDAPVIASEGRAHPVETRWAEAPPRDVAGGVAELALRALSEEPGSALAFLPGDREIREAARAVEGRLPEGCAVRPLHGSLPWAAQRAAVAPVREGRKLVLATSIAETSLTIEGVRIVIDGGRARRSRFDPGSGMARLVTEPVSRAEADQRRGRAGRTEPGVCWRAWTRGAEGALPAFAPPEIARADLAPLALALAEWGAAPSDLAFLTPPDPAAFEAARALLTDLGALRSERITDHGRVMARLPLHPRLAHMLLTAGRSAAPLAALLSDRDPMRGAGADLAPRLDALRGRGGELDRIRAEARRLARLAPDREPVSPGEAASHAYPDRIGLRRPGEAPRWLLSGGKGAAMDPGDALAGQRLIVACDTGGEARDARIRLAAPLTESELRAAHGERIAWVELCAWSRRERRVLARRQERLGAIVLDDRPWPDAPAGALAEAAMEGVRDLGLPSGPEADRLRARAAWARARGADLPDLSDEALLANLAWLAPFLAGVRTGEDIAALDLFPALQARLGWEGERALDRLAPAEVAVPSGRRVPVDYGEAPGIAVRLQEMLGAAEHPSVGGEPLRVTLLSPAGRPLQVTTDLPGFWASAYAEVRKEMRGRYPKHDWPEDPATASPSTRARRRG